MAALVRRAPGARDWLFTVKLWMLHYERGGDALCFPIKHNTSPPRLVESRMVGVQCEGHLVETAPSEEQELCRNTAAFREVKV